MAVGKRRRGLTLLEVILVLGLSTLLLYAISMAINFHLRTLDVRRSNVEEAQVARAVLNMIANDLRSTVREYRMDTKAIEQLLASAGGDLGAGGGGAEGGGDGGNGGGGNNGSNSGDSGSNGGSGAGNGPGSGNGNGSNNNGSGSGNSGSGNSGSGNSGSGNSGSGNSGSGNSGSGNSGSGNSGSGSSGGSNSGTGGTDEDGGTENTQNLASSTTLPPSPGLYGNQNQLQLDVSRLPRPDQYIPIATPNQLSLPQIPSDVKTVTYFVQNGATSGSNVRDPFAFGAEAATAPAVGLVRREVDRAVVQFSQTSGTSDALFRTGDLIAREITAIQFQYFNGLEWLPQWDSMAQKGLPVAVEILVEVTPSVRMNVAAGAATAVPQPVMYRLVVQLPLGEPAELESTEATNSGMENLGL